MSVQEARSSLYDSDSYETDVAEYNAQLAEIVGDHNSAMAWYASNGSGDLPAQLTTVARGTSQVVQSVMAGHPEHFEKLELALGYVNDEGRDPDDHQVQEVVSAALPEARAAIDAALDSRRLERIIRLAATEGHDVDTTLIEFVQQRQEAQPPVAEPDVESRSDTRPRLWRRKLVGAAMAASVLIGGGVSWSQSDGPEETVSAGTQFEYPRKDFKDVCLPPVGEQLLKTDCYPLPRITEGGSFEPLRRIGTERVPDQLIGSITPVDGERVEKLSLLPADHQRALGAALTDPIVGAVARQVPIEIRQTLGPENGSYVLEDPKTQSPEHIVLLLSSNPNLPDDLRHFQAWGSVRAILVHEGTHQIFNTWLRAAEHDVTTRRNLDIMAQLCYQDLQIVAEEFYTPENIDATRQKLQAFRVMISDKQSRGTMKQADAEAIDRAIDGVAVDLDSKERFVASTVFSDQRYGCSVNMIAGRLKAASGVEIDKRLGKEEVNILSALDLPLLHHLDQGYAHATEDTILKGLVGDGAGHLHNTTEMIASYVTTIQSNPDAVVAHIRALPAQRREVIVRLLTTFDEQFRRQNPDIAEATNLRYVLALINE